MSDAATRAQSGGVGAVPSRVNEGSPLLSHDFTRSSSGSMIDSHASGAVRGVPGYPATMGAHVEAATGQPARSAPASAPATDPALPPRWRDDQADQIRADEAFARSLADEQQQLYGRGDPGSPVALPGGGGGGGGGSAAGRQPQREQVRAAMMGELLTQRRFTQISFWLLVLLNVPQIVVITIYSIRYAHMFNSCDRPLNLWLAMYGVRLILSTVIAALPLVGPRRWHPRSESYQRLTDSFNLVGFVVFILGNFWLFDSQTCRGENPEVFKLTFALIVLQYIILMLPCVLLVCLAPMVFCCLPLLIRLSLFLPAGVGLRVLDQQGASESLIGKLPPSKRYARGMFGGEETPRKPEALPVAQGAAAAAAAGARQPGSPSVDHEEPECAICLSNYSPGEEVRQLPCQGAHHFHRQCCDDWLKIHATCPCCRESLLPLMADPALMRARVEEQSAHALGRGARNNGAGGRDSGSAAASVPHRPLAASPAQVRDLDSRGESSTLLSHSRSARDDDASLPPSRRNSDVDVRVEARSRPSAATESKEFMRNDVHIDMPK